MLRGKLLWYSKVFSRKGPNIAVKLARQVKDAKGVESFCINTQLQWDNERSKLPDPYSILVPMILAGYIAIKEVFFFWI